MLQACQERKCGFSLLRDAEGSTKALLRGWRGKIRFKKYIGGKIDRTGVDLRGERVRRERMTGSCYCY